MHIAGYGDDDGIVMRLLVIEGFAGKSNAAAISHSCHHQQSNTHLYRKEDGQ